MYLERDPAMIQLGGWAPHPLLRLGSGATVSQRAHGVVGNTISCADIPVVSRGPDLPILPETHY